MIRAGDVHAVPARLRVFGDGIHDPPPRKIRDGAASAPWAKWLRGGWSYRLPDVVRGLAAVAVMREFLDGLEEAARVGFPDHAAGRDVVVVGIRSDGPVGSAHN